MDNYLVFQRILETVMTNLNQLALDRDKATPEVLEGCFHLLKFIQDKINTYAHPMSNEQHAEDQVYYEKIDKIVTIDKGMVPLVAMMWMIGCDTIACCQGTPGTDSKQTQPAYFMFANGASADLFIKVICESGIEEFSISASPRLKVLTISECQALTRHFMSFGLLFSRYGSESTACLPPFRPCVYFSPEYVEPMTKAFRMHIQREYDELGAKKKELKSNDLSWH